MTFKYSHDEQERREPKLIFLAHSSSPCTQILAWLSIRFSMLPNLTNQYISYSMAVFSANEIQTFFSIISFSKPYQKYIQIPNPSNAWIMIISSTFFQIQKGTIDFTQQNDLKVHTCISTSLKYYTSKNMYLIIPTWLGFSYCTMCTTNIVQQQLSNALNLSRKLYRNWIEKNAKK